MIKSGKVMWSIIISLTDSEFEKNKTLIILIAIIYYCTEHFLVHNTMLEYTISFLRVELLQYGIKQVLNKMYVSAANIIALNNILECQRMLCRGHR